MSAESHLVTDDWSPSYAEALHPISKILLEFTYLITFLSFVSLGGVAINILLEDMDNLKDSMKWATATVLPTIVLWLALTRGRR